MEQKPNTKDSTVGELLAALYFAAQKHRDQRRKGTEASPYINHPIYVAHLIADVGGIDDSETLQCAILHDTVEDTQTTYEELVDAFGSAVADLVMEVTDDKSLPKTERKRLQVEHSPHLTPKAKVVKLADKIANIQDVGSDQSPSHWDEARRIEYLDWAESVAAGLMGTNEPLDTLFRSEIGRLRSKLSLVEK